jgi:hypothetical protein
MNQPSLSPDDLPPSQPTRLDRILRRQLEDSTGKRFYAACDRNLQALLSSCEWYITTNATALTLVIACPDRITNWRVLNNLVQLGSQLEQFSRRAKIRIYPPMGMDTPFEMRVDEIAVYQDSSSGEKREGKRERGEDNTDI